MIPRKRRNLETRLSLKIGFMRLRHSFHERFQLTLCRLLNRGAHCSGNLHTTRCAVGIRDAAINIIQFRNRRSWLL